MATIMIGYEFPSVDEIVRLMSIRLGYISEHITKLDQDDVITIDKALFPDEDRVTFTDKESIANQIDYWIDSEDVLATLINELNKKFSDSVPLTRFPYDTRNEKEYSIHFGYLVYQYRRRMIDLDELLKLKEKVTKQFELYGLPAKLNIFCYRDER
jgi:hypothetical protein